MATPTHSLNPPPQPFDPGALTRPAPVLLSYYMIMAVLVLPAWPILAPLLYFRYHTLRYRFDNDGVFMAWGILFRRETFVAYRRIQDIHLTRNIIQRWMGLATVSIQTASGSSMPEMSIEGLLEFEALRDYLYSKMRGAKDQGAPSTDAPAPGDDDVLAVLRGIRTELELLRLNFPESATGETPS